MEVIYLKKLILASASPRRVEIMNRFNLEYSVVPSSISENFKKADNPVALAMSIAFEKAHDVAERESDSVVIGADTIVYCGEIMGKPQNRADAFEMLKFLSGKEHTVITGVAIVCKDDNQKLIDYDITRVKFKDLSDETIDKYLDSGEYADKAGAYAVQGIGEILVDWISGSHSNVVGLSVAVLEKMLRCFKVELL